MSNTDFWQKDQEEISRLSQQRASLKEKIDQWQKLIQDAEDTMILAEMAIEEDDEITLKEVEKDTHRLQKETKALELKSLLGDPDDRRNAIIAINAPIKIVFPFPNLYPIPPTIRPSRIIASD